MHYFKIALLFLILAPLSMAHAVPGNPPNRFSNLERLPHEMMGNVCDFLENSDQAMTLQSSRQCKVIVGANRYRPLVRGFKNYQEFESFMQKEAGGESVNISDVLLKFGIQAHDDLEKFLLDRRAQERVRSLSIDLGMDFFCSYPNANLLLSLKKFTHLKKLEFISLTGSPSIRRAEFAHILAEVVSALPSLTFLDLSGVARWGDWGSAYLRPHDNYQSLLSALKTLKNLKYLKLDTLWKRREREGPKRAVKWGPVAELDGPVI
jgi:hypothetical protein